MSHADDVRAAVAAELSACEERVRTLIQTATALSEREIVAIGTRIGETNREALGNLDTFTGISGQFESDDVGGRSSLDAAVRAQTKALEAFVSALNTGLSQQRVATAGTVEVAKRILAFVARIEVVALDLRMLTLNAKLDAARWGSRGAAFATVAVGMRDLTTEVQRANDQIGTDDVDVSAGLELARKPPGAAVLRISEESELNSSDMRMNSGVVEPF